MKIVKVSDKGQIAIPKCMRELLEIGKGDELVLFDVGGKIVVEKSQNKEDFKDVLGFTEESLKKLWDNEEDEVWNTYLENDS